MIRCHLARMMGEHKMRITDVARKTAQKVGLDTIEKLCRLFECQVGDLLELTQQ
jgi:putative transcriptional regulator